MDIGIPDNETYYTTNVSKEKGANQSELLFWRSFVYNKAISEVKYMTFTMIHTNYNVRDLQKSLDFYRRALGLAEARRKEAADGSFIIVYLKDESGSFELELTWLRDWDRPYDLGDKEFHLAFRTDDYEGAYARHKAMGCIVFENPSMGIYFIEDPDGYWLEVVPVREKA